MSKRSSRRKRQEHQKKLETRLTAPVLAQQGRQAFQQADYTTAIKAWEHARQKPNPPSALAAALAEAYFRRALSQRSSSLADLQQAVKLQPKEPRYRYHLALAYHRQGALAEAEPLYRQLLAETPPFTRAAAPLTQLLIEQKRAVTIDAAWLQLTPSERAELALAEALAQKNMSTLSQLAAKSLSPFWRGLAAIALHDTATAQQCLQPLATSPDTLSLQMRSVARYYLGVIAAEAGQPAALAHWQAAQADGLDSPHLQHNLEAAAYAQALKAQQAGQPHQAVDLLAQVRQPDDAVNVLARQLNLELGYAASQKGDWATALSHWQQAEKAGDDSRRLVCNLALAYQHQQNYRQAAEYWRALLRRRPRKADHPDVLTDPQVARLWQNIAENYDQAGDLEEAITTYKNAIKWAPDNINLRLKLVETYQYEGRWQAAENELERILETDPNNVPALTMLAECYSDDYSPHRTRQLLQRVLELEPHNPVARQQLAHTYEKEGLGWSMLSGNSKKAIAVYKEGLKYVPDSQRLLVLIGGSYADWGKLELARDYLSQAIALNPGDLDTLHTIFVIWITYKSLPDLHQTLAHIKSLTPPPPGAFFMDLFGHCNKAGLKSEVEEILHFVEERYAADDDVMVSLGSTYIDLEDDHKAAAILRRVLQKNPNHIEANIELGIVYYLLGQTRLAKNHWAKAEAQARKENNLILLHRIKLTKDEYLYGKQPPRNPLEMLRSLPPNLREEFLKNAPPEVADLLLNMPPGLENILGGLNFDDDEEFYV